MSIAPLNWKRLRQIERRAAADYTHTRRQIKSERRELATAKLNLHRAREAQEILQLAAQQIQQKAHQRIAAIVTKCLRAVFDRPYEFRIDFERKRGKTAANLKFLRKGRAVDPISASGGGVVDVAAFALRVACVVLSRPKRRRLIVLDEPFAHCKPPDVLGPRICDMILSLSRELHIQFVLIPSIEDHFQIGRIVEIK